MKTWPGLLSMAVALPSRKTGRPRPRPTLVGRVQDGKQTLPAAAVWRYGGAACLALLIAAAALNGSAIQLHGLSIYPEYIALAVVLTWAIAASALGKMRWYLPTLLIPLVLWLAFELLATLLYAPDRHHSLVLWTKLPLMVTTFVLAANLARGRIVYAAGVQCAAAAGVALLAIAAYASWKITGSHLGMRHPGRNLGHSWLPAATLREPNILGSYLVAAGLLALPLALYLQRERYNPSHERARHSRSLRRIGSGQTAWRRPRRGWVTGGHGGAGPYVVSMAWVAAGLCVVGIVISGARTDWLALLVGLCIPLFLAVISNFRATWVRRAFVPLLVVAGGIVAFAALHVNPGAALPVFNPHENGSLVQRVASFGNLSREHDIVARVQVAENALTHWQAHPLTGWGVGAYGEVYTYPPPDTIHAGWISNLPIHLLYDSGLLGLVAFTLAMGLAAWRGIRAWRAAQGLTGAVIAGLLLALFGLLLAFQATEATWFAYPWIYLGLLEAAIRSVPSSPAPTLEIA